MSAASVRQNVYASVSSRHVVDDLQLGINILPQSRFDRCIIAGVRSARARHFQSELSHECDIAVDRDICRSLL